MNLDTILTYLERLGDSARDSIRRALRGKPLLLAHTSMDNVARAVAGASHGAIEYHPIAWNAFADSNPNITLPARLIEGRDVGFIASFRNQAEIFQQLAALYAIPRFGARSFHVFLPYFEGLKERVDHEGEVATAMTYARLLSSIPRPDEGGTRIHMWDIHALPERFFFTDNVVPKLHSAIPLLLERLHAPEWRGAHVVFPDEGSFKRFGALFQGFERIICEKRREGEVRRIVIKEGNPAGAHTLIVDDLAETCGTLLECADVLTAKRALSVSTFFTHAVCPAQSWKKLLGGRFRRVITTDSCPATVTEMRAADVFEDVLEVISLSDDITRALLRA